MHSAAGFDVTGPFKDRFEDILKDAYITNRLSPEQAKRLLDRPDILHAFGDDLAAAHKAAGNGGQSA